MFVIDCNAKTTESGQKNDNKKGEKWTDLTELIKSSSHEKKSIGHCYGLLRQLFKVKTLTVDY